MKRNQKYIVQCLKGNNNRHGFGYRYKKGQYVTYSGKPTFDINEAYVYCNNEEGACGLD